jgi:tetratricopeptide (TPR) repeat protein
MKDSKALVENCKTLIALCEEALKVYTLDHFPVQYGIIHNNLGNAYLTLSRVEDEFENLEKAIKAYEEVFKVFTEEEFPETYQLLQSYLFFPLSGEK